MIKNKEKNTCVIVYPYVVEYGGIERNIVGLAREIIRRNLEFVLLVLCDRICMEKYEPGIKVVELGDDGSPLTKSMKISKWIDKERNVIVGLPLYFGGKAGFYGGISGSFRWALHYTDPPSLLSTNPNSRSNPIDGFRKIRSRLSELIVAIGVRRANVRLTMTRRNADELEGIYGKPFDVIYQGGKPAPVSTNRKKPFSNEVLRIFSICRITNSKKLSWIITAAHALGCDKSVRDKFQKIEVTIAGTGPELQNLKRQAEAQETKINFSFPGFLNDDSVENEFENTDLFLVPAKQGYGLPVLESLYRGIPVVVNVESRISEILRGNSWVAVTEDSEEEFTKATIDFINKFKEKNPSFEELAKLPTEEDWASSVGLYCNWWK